jgi:hypothetical protein
MMITSVLFIRKHPKIRICRLKFRVSYIENTSELLSYISMPSIVLQV